MMDMHSIETQLKKLKNARCKLDWASGKYGIDFNAEKQLLGRFRAWASRFKNINDVMDSTTIDRFVFESFLQFYKLIPLKYAAIQLGTDDVSLKEIIKKMQADGMLPYHADFDSLQIIEEPLIDNFTKLFPQLNGYIFSSHSSRCKAIHEAVKNDLKIDVKPLFCKTSELIDDSPEYEYAYEFDALTSEPMGVKYQLWMDTEKPIILKPDACSMLTYFECEKQKIKIKLLGNYDDRLYSVYEKIKSKEKNI
jgi:hypothetical protein